MSNFSVVQSTGLLAKPVKPVGQKKFSLVPFAKAKSSSVYSSASEATSLTQVPNIQTTKDRMDLIQETPEDIKDASGKDLQAALGIDHATTPTKNQVNEVEDEDDDDDDDYEDDNDFEPFETSKKDLYQADSQESKTQKTESEAKSLRDQPSRQTPDSTMANEHQMNT